MTTATSWRRRGDVMEACNCVTTCPCNFSGDPTQLPCEAILGFRIQEGNHGGTRLDGSTTLHKGEEIIHGAFFGQSSFANYALASERNVVKVRQDIPLEILGPLGCGIQTGAQRPCGTTLGL